MRVTQHDLEISVANLNRITGFGENVKYNTNGAYQLDWAYGGVQLVRVCNNVGGVETISSGGYVPKRELYNQINAIVRFGHLSAV